jgi:hypothetical protein
MNVKETDFPTKFQPIIRRLQQAVQVKEVRDIMIVEDDFLAEIHDYENRIATSQENEKIALQQKAEALQKQAEAIKLMLDLGVEIEVISKKLDLSIDEIKRIVE